MTTILTRYFESADQAESAKRELMYTHRVSPAIIRIFNDPKGLTDALTKADVVPDTAKTYSSRMKSGGAVLMVRGKYKPLGVTKIARQVAEAKGAVDLGDINQEVFVKDERGRGLSILPDHGHIFLRPRDPDQTNYHMADWPLPLISRRKPFNETAIPRHGRMANWPIPLLSTRKPYTGSIFPRHARMANFPIRLISKRKPFTGSIFPRHARMANFPLPLISRRKPWDRFAFPRHMRMANWPFPHLINGEEHTNAIIPDSPHMANFPIGLLSDRKPYDGSIFPKHARMAKFPIGLISKRKPITASVFSRHARMADLILPLVTRRVEDGGEARSFSKLLGWPTIKR